MRFSVVIPCRDEHARLAACLDALAAQDFPRHGFEVVVVDGGATLAPGALALDPGIQLLRDEGRGPAAARNLGIRASRGEIVAFTDADCVPRFDWLSRLDDALREEPDAAGMAGGLRLPRRSILGRLEDNDARVRYAGYITSNVAYRRDALDAVGGFDETLRCAEDYDLAWRILEAGMRIGRAPQATVLHDPPELADGLRPYLAKQFWYARHDVPAHARALRRGATAPRAGVRSALANSAWASAATVGLFARRPILGLASLAGAGFLAARDVAEAVEAVGEGEDEIVALSLVESAKRLVRGAGTIVGLVELGRPSSIRALRSAGPSPWMPRLRAPQARSPA